MRFLRIGIFYTYVVMYRGEYLKIPGCYTTAGRALRGQLMNIIIVVIIVHGAHEGIVQKIVPLRVLFPVTRSK